ncbi:MAG TPA: hypothetical protein PKJ99_09630 [Thermoanaerobaculales bacterium]|nr:hypothetical protein [Thermoanaerobaculales bacterium]HQP34066.1 hypothetical protein [Polyangiaceae bacterium]
MEGGIIMTITHRIRCATFAAALSVLLLPDAGLAQQEYGTAARSPRIDAYQIFQEDLAKPMVRIDETGVLRSYSRAYVVRLDGDFGEPRAIPLDVFIGDYKVPEYGGNETTLYFRIYDEALLRELEGQPFGFGFEGEKVRTFDLRFSPDERRPFGRFDAKAVRASPED